MKKLSLSLVLVISLQGAPLPAQAGNGMTDILSTMMQMFLWMMSSGGGMQGFSPSGMSPYSLNPYGLGGQAYPSQRGYYQGGNGGWGRSPYSQYGYGNRSPYSSPYNRSFNDQYRYDRYGNPSPYGYPEPGYPDQSKPSTLVIQPIIVSPGKEEDGVQTSKIEYLPAHSVEPVAKVVANSASYNKVFPPQVNNYNAWDFDNPLPGRWQGVNGEFLELGTSRFNLRSLNAEMLGTYQIKNGIMKADIFNRTEPVYMQYRMAEGQLLFRAADGQMMLFRRMD